MLLFSSPVRYPAVTLGALEVLRGTAESQQEQIIDPLQQRRLDELRLFKTLPELVSWKKQGQKIFL